ncbi:hypothetical protein N0V93_007289 [Gnomoniopsis smithogilvyi]|uniref:Uncharacterized protein n=1 Tax=Gnomoniopsis smithogilvyi TaxID=1191159 RepID=A0A9W8YPS9_9PEZI|nr:hypothetical protein N0V93_007289 [Gnomoniopsis smithogilvyi]
MAPSKRPHEVIDLTDDSPVRPKNKIARTNASSSQVYSSSSAARPSQSIQASQGIGYGASSDPRARLHGQSRGLASQERDSFDDEPELVDLTQADDGPVLGLYGTINNKIVGVRYYSGIVSPGEVVILRREPTNPYDRNAVRVDNVAGAQVGHLPRKLVEKLVPYIDSGDVHVEGMITGEKQFFDCPIRILVYGTSEPLARAALEQRLKADKLLKATELKQTRAKLSETQRKAMGLKGSQSTGGLGPDEPEVSLEQLAQASQAVQYRAGADNLKTLAMDEDTLSKLPMAPQPEALRSQLLPYQLQGLAWLQSQEDPQFPKAGSDDATQLWRRTARGHYKNVATNYTVANAPRLAKGGILADDMGLGKTLQMISLILTGGPGPTLIIAPVSVMSNWSNQIITHVHKSKTLRVAIYHGAGKMAAKDLKNHDVVVTSYGTLSSDRDSTGPLFSLSWHRVILDEGHNIRNARAKCALAACELKAEARWVLTGTPIVNSIRDLQSIVKFLKLTGGIEEPEVFNTVITRPLAQGSPDGEVLLQSLMQGICLRRKKDMAFVDLRLPPKSEYVHRITFRAEEKKKYEALLSEAKGVLEKVQAKTKHGATVSSVLERLLRLRQVCNHWTLCKERVIDLLETLEDQDVVVLNDKNRDILQQALALVIESQEECPVCIDQLTLPVITACKHTFCGDCIRQVIQTQGKCPMCRAAITEDHLVEPAPETSGEEDRDIDSDTQSSKTEALLKILQATFQKDGSSKVIIFSQWAKFLTIIETQVKVAGYKYTRIDGSMPTKTRDAAIQALQEDPDCRIMLASLAVCSVGLNLVAADTVVLADSWWAPAIEDQAVDRVHRLGQMRPTTVWRLVMEGTVEERVLDIQSEKRLLVGKAFQEKTKGKKTKDTRMSDIIKLLG